MFGYNQDLTPDATGLVGQVLVDGNGYNSFWALDGTAMYLGHNSGIRGLGLMTDETTRLYISGGGDVGIGTINPLVSLDVSGSIYAKNLISGANLYSAGAISGASVYAAGNISGANIQILSASGAWAAQNILSLSGALNGCSGAITNHIADNTNPHGTLLNQANIS